MKGLHALITGASSGLGAEFARQLHDRGASVMLTARRRNRLKDLCSRLNALRPDSAFFVVADLTLESDSGGIKELERYIKANRIDILVNNAGFGSFGRLEKLELQKELKMVFLNIAAPLRLTHAVLPQMKERKSGSIINVSSIAAMQPIPFMSTYSATKAFNLNHSLALRHECLSDGIRVLGVCPGPVETEFGDVAGYSDEDQMIMHESPANVVRLSLNALNRNAAWVIPGFKAKLSNFPSLLLPVSLSTKLVGWYLRRISK